MFDVPGENTTNNEAIWQMESSYNPTLNPKT